MITLRQLEIFLSAVREGSFRKCGERLGISQVVVSEHVRALEDRLGQPLFQRRAGGPAVLTDAGQRAVRGATAILASVGDFVDEVAGHTKQRRVRIAVEPFILRNRHDLIEDVRLRFPQVDIELDLDPGTAAEAIDRVARREVDLACFFAFEGQDEDHSEFAYHEPLAIFVSPGHALARTEPVGSEELRDIPAVHVSRRRPLRRLIEQALDAIGAGGGKVAMETDEFGLILSCVHRGHGFACMFEATEEEFGQTFGMVRVPLQTRLPALEVRIAMRPAARHDPLLLAVRDALTRRSVGMREAP